MELQHRIPGQCARGNPTRRVVVNVQDHDRHRSSRTPSVNSVGCVVRDLVALLIRAIPQEFVHPSAMTLTGEVRQITRRDRPQAGRLAARRHAVSVSLVPGSQPTVPTDNGDGDLMPHPLSQTTTPDDLHSFGAQSAGGAPSPARRRPSPLTDFACGCMSRPGKRAQLPYQFT